VSAAPIWRVEFDPDAAHELRKLGHDARRLVLKYLRERIATTDDPRRFGHALLGDLKGLWRYRVGDYRVVADIRNHEILVMIVTVGHRRNVYD
jgi:mRNA interferase RelE/StbE